ncbi:hypothetical protein GYM69_09820 [Lactobacillus panisapium]|uniref:SLAP domain-containing protein n=1 Tax=Lactobacillus panisapium TaxID=2012495 RepID=UPI001C69FBB8|nr:SLAP domain-containing protein [Lactobacillus panisapium]QYN57397.1 hypothetical protein GYM69_09820 [Lactobacillus panisapium]
MKKNLRIVSAAAAALLAVAPVAATSVSTVFADTPVSVVGGTTNPAGTEGTLKLVINNALSLSDQTSADKLNVTLSTPKLPAADAGKTISVSAAPAKVFLEGVVSLTKQSDGTVKVEGNSDEVVQKVLKADSTKYQAFTYATISNVKPDTSVTINGYKFTSDHAGTISNVPVLSESFSLANPGLTGAPYAKEVTSGKAVDSGSVDLNQYSVHAILVAIQAKYAPGITTQAGTQPAAPSFTNLRQDVRDGVKAAGITTRTDPDETFDKPAAPFPITVRLSATNGKSSSFVVTVNPNPTEGDDTFPTMTLNGTRYQGTKSIDVLPDVDAVNKFNYVPVNGVVDTKAIQDAFKTTVSGTDLTTLVPTVDASKVNTKVAGKYPVTVTATNADKKTTKVTFMLTVGAKGATYKTVQSDGDVPVYKIEGNTVTDTKTTVKNGDQIAIFGDAIKVGDKSYTRINSADSNLYVETKYVDGSFKPADKTSKTVMHNAYIYDKDHKRVGTNMLRAYTKVDVLGAATKLADGSLVYQIGDNQYVMADNIDGTVRTLSHNAYVYKTSKKRADSRVLRKGAKVTTYGSPYTFKNGKAYYRIGGPSKQYVKVANFN